MYVKFTNLIFLLYKLVIVIVGNSASSDRTPNKEKLATERVAGLCATLPTGEIRIYPDGRGQLYTGLALASAPVV